MSSQNPKVSIITVVKNGMPYLKESIKSYKIQDYKNKELIVVYSNSQDRTYSFLKTQKCINKLIIDNKTNNKFGALNSGLKNSSGDIIGILHADDIFASSKVLSIVASKFQETKFDICYGNIKFSLRNNLLAIKRVWISSSHNWLKVFFGWMPPHVSLFITKKNKNTLYSNKYLISGDYDYILRVIKKSKKIIHINYFFTIMRLGGISNKLIFKKTQEDILIAKKYLGLFSIFTIICKNLIKIPQFIKRQPHDDSYSSYIKKNFVSGII